MPENTLSSQSKSIQGNQGKGARQSKHYTLQPSHMGQQNQQTAQTQTPSAHGFGQNAEQGVELHVQQSIQQAQQAMQQVRQAIDHVVSQGMLTPQQILRQAQEQLQEAHRQINETQQEINYLLRSLR